MSIVTQLRARRIERGIPLKSVAHDLGYSLWWLCQIEHHNAEPKPFTWTADPDKIIAAVRRGHQVLDSVH